MIDLPELAKFEGERDVMLQKYLDLKPVVADLEACFDDIGPGEGDGAGEYARRAFQPLSHYYFVYAPQQLRDLAPLPSPATIEQVAARWARDGLDAKAPEKTTLA